MTRPPPVEPRRPQGHTRERTQRTVNRFSALWLGNASFAHALVLGGGCKTAVVAYYRSSASPLSASATSPPPCHPLARESKGHLLAQMRLPVGFMTGGLRRTHSHVSHLPTICLFSQGSIGCTEHMSRFRQGLVNSFPPLPPFLSSFSSSSLLLLCTTNARHPSSA